MSAYLRHFAGFLIQFWPCMLLCLLPFRQQDFRLPQKKLYLGCGLIGLGAAVLYPLVRGLIPLLSIENGSVVSNLYMLAVVAACAVLYFRLVRAETVKKLVVLMLVVFYAATQYLLVNLVSPLFPQGELPDAYPPLILALYAATAAVMLPGAVLLMRRTVGDYLAEVEPRNIRREFSIALLATALYFVMLILYSSRPDSGVGDFWWWVTPPFLLTAAVLCIFYWSLFRESVRRKRDSEQQKALEIQRLQYDKITAEMENARRMRHDLRHYLARLSDLLEQGKTEELRALLAQVTEDASRRENEVYCRGTVVNGLLQYYVGQARSKDIRCEVQADCGELDIAAADLTVIFGNAMENAVRACLEYPGERFIRIRVGVISGSLMVQVTNPCKGVRLDDRYRQESGYLPAAAYCSTRAGGGCGLRSMEHTARKYGGDAAYRYDADEQTFTARVRLDLHAGAV